MLPERQREREKDREEREGREREGRGERERAPPPNHHTDQFMLSAHPSASDCKGNGVH